MSDSTQNICSEAHLKSFQTNGFFLLEKIVPPADLSMMREECGRFISAFDAEMDLEGVTKKGLNVKGSRYFISNRYRESRLGQFIFGDVMAEICRATLGANAYLFWEQFVVKGPEKGAKFSWHQDSGYIDVPHAPYITCWVTLDDVTEDNGTVYLLPYERAGSRELAPHRRNPETNDKEGYFGSDPGDAIVAPAGSIAVFSSLVFHRSGFNRTPDWRRVYLPQYSAEPLRKPDGALINRADPIWRDGVRHFGT